MSHTRMIIGGFLLGMLASAALLAVLILGLGPTSAAPVSERTLSAASAPAAPTATSDAPSGPPAAADLQQHYANLLVQTFAAKLGVDQARLNSAFAAAASDTIDQAVRDGQLDAEAAPKLKAATGQGLAAILPPVFGKPEAGTAVGGRPNSPAEQAAVGAIMPAIVQRLGMTPDQFGTAIKSGQTLAALEQAHNVTHQQLKDAVLAAVRAAVNDGVQKGQWTQADADRTYQMVSDNIDAILMKLTGGAAAPGDKGGPGASGTPGADVGPEPVALDAMNTAVAGLFGLSFGDFETALHSGQTLLALEQAHRITEQQVHDAALAAARGALDKGAQAGDWTPADADKVFQALSPAIYNYLLKIRNAFPVVNADQAAENAVAGLLGMTDAQFRDALQGGQTLPALLQAHNVSPQQVHDAAQTAGHTALATGAQQGQWTAAQADDSRVAFDETLDSFLAGFSAPADKPGAPPAK